MTIADHSDLPEQGERLLEKQLQLYLSQNLRLLDIPGIQLINIEHEVTVGRIDILAQGPDEVFWVIETKRELATREDIGQLQSYMGALRMMHPTRNIRGILVAAGLSDGARAALVVAEGIEFYAYRLQFTFRPEKVFAFQVPPASQTEKTNTSLRAEKRYCMICRDHVLANVNSNGTAICTRCRNAL